MTHDVEHKVTCVVVSYHRVDGARRALRQVAHPDLDVILVNVENDPDIAAIPGDHRVIGLEGNPGYAAAVNAGVALANADHVVFANDDASITAAGILALVAPIVAGCADVTVPCVVGADGAPVRTIASIPTPGSLVREWMVLPDHPVRALARHVRVEKWRAPRSPERIDAAAAVVVAARRTLLVEEPLPEAYFLYWEESEWFWRLRERGAVVQYRPEVACMHDGGRDDVRSEKSRLLSRNAVRCVRRTQGRGAALVAITVVIAWNARLVLADGLRCVAHRDSVGRARLRARSAGLWAALTCCWVSSMSVLIVDWLGRGGIAQASDSWALELRASGTHVDVVTRPGRELHVQSAGMRAVSARSGRIVAHRDVARQAARRIRELRPDVVIVQNYVAPPLERRVHVAARTVGARIVVVVHNDQVHTLRAGTRVGLRSQLQRADVVVADTNFVANGIRAFAGRNDVVVIPLPVPVGMVRGGREQHPGASDDRLIAAAFGVLKRSYKGTSVFRHLAETGVDGWRFVAIGAGAPTGAPGIDSVAGYVPPERLAAEVEASDATIAPYVHATQSAVVVLGHALGSVPVATGVGGISEQIDDGVDGILLAADAPIDAWRDSLIRLADDDVRKSLAVAGEARAWRDHEAFVRGIQAVTR